MLAGFRSRWTMPSSCAASRASAIWRAIGSASASGSGPRAMCVREVLALDELHHERADAVRLLDAVDGGDVRMIERGERLGLAREPGEALGVGGDGGGQDLDGDVAIELGVAGAIDLAHSAFAKLRDDAIRAEALSSASTLRLATAHRVSVTGAISCPLRTQRTEPVVDHADLLRRFLAGSFSRRRMRESSAEIEYLNRLGPRGIAKSAVAVPVANPDGPTVHDTTCICRCFSKKSSCDRCAHIAVEAPTATCTRSVISG